MRRIKHLHSLAVSVFEELEPVYPNFENEGTGGERVTSLVGSAMAYLHDAGYDYKPEDISNSPGTLYITADEEGHLIKAKGRRGG